MTEHTTIFHAFGHSITNIKVSVPTPLLSPTVTNNDGSPDDPSASTSLLHPVDMERMDAYYSCFRQIR